MALNRKLVIIDSNIWISWLLNQFNSELNKIIRLPQFDLISSPELTAEVLGVIQRPKFKSRITTDHRDEFEEQFKSATKEITVTSIIAVCRDPKDNFLLALAKDSYADYLVTGDNDLLSMKKFGRTHIVTLQQLISFEVDKD